MRQKNIILCGFMGCGKSTVGVLLARKCGMAFVDLDSWIERMEGKTVSQIFADSGEEHFRALERQASRELSKKNGVVIAAGGGTLTFPENVSVLKENGIIILLDLPVEVISERLKNDKTRPLLNRPDKEEAMRELYNRRMPLYEAAADIKINADCSPMQICRDIISMI